MSIARSGAGTDILTSVADWLPGECLYGWCARYFLAHGFHADSTSAALFSKARAHQYRNLPSGLDRFVTVTQGQLGSVEEILTQRTVACSYLPFLSNEQRIRVMAAASRSDGPSLLEVLNRITARAGSLLELRYCPQCHQAALRAHSDHLRLLEHQLPGVWYCRAHGCALKVQTHPATGWDLPGDEERTSSTCEQLPEPGNPRESMALRMCSGLAAAISRLPRIDSKALTLDSIHHLAALGLSSARRMNSPILDEWFSYSPIGQWLARAQMLRSPPRGWIANLLKGRSPPTPLKWTLLWCAIWDQTPSSEAILAFEEVAMRKPQFVETMFGRQIANSWETHQPRARTGRRRAGRPLMPGMDVSAPTPTDENDQVLIGLARFDNAREAVQARRLERAAQYAVARQRVEGFLANTPTVSVEAVECALKEDAAWLQRFRPVYWNKLLLELGVTSSPQMSLLSRPLGSRDLPGR